MKKTLIALAALAACAGITTRARTHDVAFTYRMGGGFVGDINRTHPASILPGLQNSTNPIRLYGDPALINAADGSYRGIIVSDTADANIAGVLARPYPIQQQSGGPSAALGSATPPQTAAALDVLEDGFILVKCNNFGANAPTRGGAVYCWYAANSGNHVQGGFEAAATVSNTFKVLNAEWNSPVDSNGVAELRVWKAKQ